MHIKNDCLNSIISKLIDLVKIKFNWRLEGEFLNDYLNSIFRKLIDLLGIKIGASKVNSKQSLVSWLIY